MPFRDDATALIHQKKFEDLESLWMTQIDSDPSDVDSFLHIAKALRKAEQRTQSDTLIGLLADSLKERQLWYQRLQVLKEIGRLSKHPATLRPQIEEALRKSVGTQDRKSTRLNSSHLVISYAVFCLKKKKSTIHATTAEQITE